MDTLVLVLLFKLLNIQESEWIMKQWEKNYYISSIAGANNGSSLMVMSKAIRRRNSRIVNSDGDGGGGVGKIFEKYHVGGGFVSTVNEAAMITNLLKTFIVSEIADKLSDGGGEASGVVP
ncbi:hypothetical protein Tco_0923894 [Tanacetum coccineum]|uniref:DUF7477 domain-containing protein n=1 Tax=Tanacetum coccineum TaxID=301880 RepID=A0ABQ5D3N6_9ASTR